MSDQKDRFRQIGRDAGGEDKIVEYYGDGTALTEKGDITKHNYLEFLNIKLHNYRDLHYTKEELESVRKHLRFLSTGHASAVPLLCAAEKCPFASTCPLQLIGRAPLGKQCIPENEFVNLKRRQYMEEYEIDPRQPSMMTLVNELAEIDIYEMRATLNLAKNENADLFIDEVVNVTESGHQITQKRIHPAFEIKEKLKNRRMRILEVLVGTPKEKYKRQAALKKVEGDDYSITLTEVQQTLRNLKRQTEDIAFKNAKQLLPAPEEQPPEEKIQFEVVDKLADLEEPKE